MITFIKLLRDGMQFTGEEEEGDDELLRGPQEVARDEWMTKLPPERQVCPLPPI